MASFCANISVQESLMAVPYAYSQLGAYGKAANLYNHAMTVFSREITSLDNSIKSIRKGKFLTALLNEDEKKLDMVLQLTTRRFLDRRLQTVVFGRGDAKSIHHARVLIKQRHIRVGKRMVDVASFMVRTDAEKHIAYAHTSPFGHGRKGRKARKTAKVPNGDKEDDE